MAGGQSATFGQGFVSVGNGLTIALVGAAIVASTGTISANPHGLEMASAIGSVGVDAKPPLAGIAVTASTGTLTPSGQQPSLVGAGITSATGTLSASGNAVTAHLSGEEITSGAGILSSGGQLLGGSAITGAQGAYVLTVT